MIPTGIPSAVSNGNVVINDSVELIKSATAANFKSLIITSFLISICFEGSVICYFVTYTNRLIVLKHFLISSI